jgi:hypothetical protein
MLIGEMKKVQFNKEEGLHVYVQQNENAQKMARLFDMGQEKMAKFAEDFGIDVSGKDEFSLPGLHVHINRYLQKMLFEKAKTYLKPGEKAPEGVTVQTGPLGGRFYIPPYLTPAERGKRGGIATASKYGREHMQKIGKKGYAATVDRIHDMMINPDKYPDLDDDDVINIARFLKWRLRTATDTYRNQFRREWRKRIKELPDEAQQQFSPERKKVFQEVSEALFGNGKD